MSDFLRRGALAFAAVGLCAAVGTGCTRTNPNVAVLNATPTTEPPVSLTTEASPFGPILATSSGQTLYDFTPDGVGFSACVSTACITEWPPLLSDGTIVLHGGVVRHLVSTIERANGTLQVSYGGHPLYTYNDDVKRHSILGQDIDDEGGYWYVLNVDGEQITTPPTGA